MPQDTKMSKREEKPSFYVYIILCIIVIVAFVVIIISLFGKQAIFDADGEKFKHFDIPTLATGKANCNLVNRYCFEDGDCEAACDIPGYTCIHGVCKRDFGVVDVTNKCDPKMGMIGYLTGNTALGTYEYICQSVDPAIAISVDENRMCFGDNTYQIDYIKEFPTTKACECVGRIVVPATREKREHVECSPLYAGMFII
ncbi:PIF-3 [Penaeus vannamei nudivirus]|nr:PIF-3 [Penaeus vannamei nucleopolyhedrovirus]